MQTIQGSGRAAGMRFAVVVSKYNDFVTDRLQAGALAALAAAGVSSNDVTIVRVPGAFEIPLAAQHAGETGRYDAVVCLGCLIPLRAAAQGFIAFATLGAGMFIGSWFSGEIVDAFAVANGAEVLHIWGTIWVLPAAGAAAVLILFALFFRAAEEAGEAAAAGMPVVISATQDK